MNKKILQIILIISCFFSNIISDYKINPDGESCVNAPDNPTSETDCTSYNTEDTACCFARIELEDRSKINKCLPVQKDARFALNYLTIFSFKDNLGNEYENVIADFECGQTEGLCGMDSPEKIFQCSEHSSTTRSCCYLTTPTYTECILSSEKYNKETKFDLFGGSSVVCNSNNLKTAKKHSLIIFAIIIDLILFI